MIEGTCYVQEDNLNELVKVTEQYQSAIVKIGDVLFQVARRGNNISTRVVAKQATPEDVLICKIFSDELPS